MGTTGTMKVAMFICVTVLLITAVNAGPFMRQGEQRRLIENQLQDYGSKSCLLRA